LIGAAGIDAKSVPLTLMDNSDPELVEELMLAVERVAYSGAFTLGTEVEEFESEFAAFCEAPSAIGVSSGTDALALALQGLGIGPGDEVIVPTNSFIATAEAVTLVGASPRLVDVDPMTHLLTADVVERNLTRRTACIIPVHLYGRTVDLDPILSIARERGIRVVEDACQAHGARYHGARVGTIGDAGCFSFYPTKNLGAWGDGGAVVTADQVLSERLRLLRSHGERPRHRHRMCAGTSRLHAVQAAILRVKLRRLEDANVARRRLGSALARAFAGCESVRPPVAPELDGDHVFHLFPVVARDREGFQAHLERRGVATAVHYPTPIHLQEAYAFLGMTNGSLPIAERLAAHVCSLPLFPSMTDAQFERVTSAVLEYDASGAPAPQD
jgi:dTDP-3-amino-3,4,6-trideoxy-alpha-D-glucose transaminase